MAYYDSAVSNRRMSIIGDSPQGSGPNKITPSNRRPPTTPIPKDTVDTKIRHSQQNIMNRNLAGAGYGGSRVDKRALQVTAAEAFLKHLKTEGIVDGKLGGRLAEISQKQKEELVTLGLKRHSGQPYERVNARRAIIAYADRYGLEEAMAFKDALLQRRPHWINGRSVKKRTFQLLGTTSDPTGLDLKAFEPENLEKLRVSTVLEGKLRSAGQKHPTLANMDPLLSLKDIETLSKFNVLFSKDGGSAMMQDLLHVATLRDNHVSGGENRQKIRDLMLLATAKWATAALADGRNLSLEGLKALKMELLTAGQRGPKQLAKRYNEEMAKLAFQPGTHDAPGLGEIGKTSAEAQAYRTNFQASVEAWSENNQHRFIGLSKLQELSRMAVAPILNKRKLDAYDTALKNNEVGFSNLLFKPATKRAYFQTLKRTVEWEATSKGRVLDNREFEDICGRVFDSISKQVGVQKTLV